jgi:hypothetical protein
MRFSSLRAVIGTVERLRVTGSISPRKTTFRRLPTSLSISTMVNSFSQLKIQLEILGKSISWKYQVGFNVVLTSIAVFDEISFITLYW